MSIEQHKIKLVDILFKISYVFKFLMARHCHCLHSIAGQATMNGEANSFFK